MSFGKAPETPGLSPTLASPYTPTKAAEYTPGMHITIQIWFAQLWRQALWTLLVIVMIFVGAFIFGFILGFIGGKGAWDSMRPIFTIVGGVCGGLGGIWAWHKAFVALLGKQFSGYRLVLLTPDSADKTP